MRKKNQFSISTTHGPARKYGNLSYMLWDFTQLYSQNLPYLPLLKHTSCAKDTTSLTNWYLVYGFCSILCTQFSPHLITLVWSLGCVRQISVASNNIIALMSIYIYNVPSIIFSLDYIYIDKYVCMQPHRVKLQQQFSLTANTILNGSCTTNTYLTSSHQVNKKSPQRIIVNITDL